MKYELGKKQRPTLHTNSEHKYNLDYFEIIDSATYYGNNKFKANIIK